MEEGGIEEASTRSTQSESRWVDGSEVDSESSPWSQQQEEVEGAPSQGFSREGSLRRRLSKKPKRSDSLDVEAMGIADAHKLHNKMRSKNTSKDASGPSRELRSLTKRKTVDSPGKTTPTPDTTPSPVKQKGAKKRKMEEGKKKKKVKGKGDEVIDVMAYRGIPSCRCSAEYINKIEGLFGKMKEKNRLNMMKTSCFGFLFHTRRKKRNISIPWLAHYFWQRHVGELVFDVEGVSMACTPLEWSLVFGLRYDTNPLPPLRENRGGDRLRNLVKSQKANAAMVWETLEQCNRDEDAVKLALLLCLMTYILGVNRWNSIPNIYFELVDDLEKFNNYPWGNLSFEAMKKGLEGAIKKNRRPDKYNIFGPFYALQAWIFERIPSLGLEFAMREEKLKCPRILNWFEPMSPSYRDIVHFIKRNECQIVDQLIPTEDEKEDDFYKFFMGNNQEQVGPLALVVGEEDIRASSHRVSPLRPAPSTKDRRTLELKVSQLERLFTIQEERNASQEEMIVSQEKRISFLEKELKKMDPSIWHTVAMAFQTLGIVYGDMGTSPLYVYSDVFSKVQIKSEVDVLGALSLVMYTIALLPFAKYVFIVLKANDNGEGGTFALYSLICRYARVSLLPNQQRADEDISSFRLKLPTPELERALTIKENLERRSSLKTLLLLLVLMGTSMIIGDGILTPAMSVMSAVSGLQGEIPGFNTDAVVIVSIVILVALFSIQRFGTGKVGYLFAPVLALWFFSLGSIGIYNLFKYDISVLRAFNPAYIYLFFKRNGSKAWSALGGVVLCITGAEAMFADLGHFSVKSIQMAFTFLVFPCLLLAYMGQAAYLMKNSSSVERIFYDSVPKDLFWPVFVIATLAAMIASQAMISATFSCIKQSLALGCFPRLKIVHTSRRFMGQIYIPVVNWFLMIMCILVVATFRSTTDIANAYGIAEVGVMMVSTTLVTLVMLLIWKTNLFLALLFPAIFGTIELIYLSAVLTKIMEGGWLPLVFASFFLCVMYIWYYGSVLKYQSEMREKISMDLISDLGSTLGTVRVPGIGLVYNELVQGIPSIFGQFLITLPAIHSTIVFVCIKYVPVPVVPQEERFLFRRVCQKDFHMFRCIARYGYKDVRKEDHQTFEQLLVESLEKFLRREAQELALEMSPTGMELDDESVTSWDSGAPSGAGELQIPLLSDQRLHNRSISFAEGDNSVLPSSAMPSDEDPSLEYELSALREAMESGFTYLLAQGDVRARKDSWFMKKLVINYFYAFLRRNCRAGAAILRVPHMNIIRVGMTYMV